MSRVSWRALSAHKLRSLLTVLAVALGVALMAGTYVLTDTITASFGSLMHAAYSGESVIVEPATPLGADNAAELSPITGAMVARARDVPGVATAAGEVIHSATVLSSAGKALGTAGFTFVAGVVPAPFDPVSTSRGRLPTGPGEAAVDEQTAALHHLRLGDVVEVAGAAPVRNYHLVGTVRFAGTSSFAGGTLVVLTVPQAQAVTAQAGRYGQIDIEAAPGISPVRLRAAVASALPHDVQVLTGAQEASQATSDLADNIGFFRTFLLVFAYVALFVGGFIILNTFSVTVAQRTRETGLLRAMGASRRQVLWSVVTESAVIGLVGALAGLGLGLVMAPGLDEVFKIFGANLPDRGTVLQDRTIIVSVLAGLIVSVASGLAPALRATRISPMAALGGDAGARRGRTAGHMFAIGLAVLATGVAMVVDGIVGHDGGLLAGTGALVVFAGVALLSTRLVPGLARAVGVLVTWRGAPGSIARENARRQPGRTAATSAAMMVGLALVTFVSVLGAGSKATIDSAVHSSFAGNLIVEAGALDNQGLPPSLATGLRKVPGVAVVAPVSFSEADVKGANGAQEVTGVDPVTLSRLYRVEWDQGSVTALTRLTDSQVLLTSSLAKSDHLHLGSRLSVLTASGRHLHLVVTGVVSDRARLFGPLTVTRALLHSEFGQSSDGIDFVGYATGATNSAVQPTVDRLLHRDFPQAESQTAAQYVQQQASEVDSLLALVYVLLALAVIVSLFGLLNTLALAVHERTRELGLLRAVGMTRHQVRQMVRYESVITSLIGAVTGLTVGAVFAASLARSIAGPGFVLSFPVATLMVLVVLAALAGVGAAVLPARRASRLDILAAITFDQ
jgi:putative ABC transport system permease protein